MKHITAKITKTFTRRTATVAVLTAINIFFAVTPARAQSQTETPLEQPQIIAQLSECSVPMNGVLKIQYSGGPVLHQATFFMEGCTGKLTTTFFNGQTETVEQTMVQHSSSRGIVWLGYDPVYAGTDNPHPSYSPDNFLFQQDIQGNWNLRNCDDANVCSPIEVLDFQE